MKALEVTFRDMYKSGTDTVILQGNFAKRFMNSPYKSDMLIKLETVSFTAPYVISTKWVNA